MPFSQISLGCQVPLVADSIGASRFRLYQATLPFLKRQKSLPISLTNQSILGRRTRISLLKKALGKRFLSDGDFEFLANSELLGSTEEFIASEAAVRPLSSSENIETLLVESTAAETVSDQLLSPELSQSLPSLRLVKPLSHQVQVSRQKINQANSLTSAQDKQLPNYSSAQADTSENLEHIQDRQPQFDGFSEANLVSTLMPSEHNPQIEQFEPIERYQEVQITEFCSQQTADPHQSDPLQAQNLEEQKPGKEPVKRIDRLSALRQGSRSKLLKQSRPEKLPRLEQDILFKPHLQSDIQKFSNPPFVSRLGWTGSDFQQLDKQNLIYESIDGSSFANSRISNLIQPNETQEVEPLDELTSRVEPKSQLLIETAAPVDSELSGTTAAIPISEPKIEHDLPSPVNELIQQSAIFSSLQGFSTGGQVTNSNAPAKSIDPSDTVPAMLTPGEFVVNATDAQKHLPLLHHLNQGGLEVPLDQDQISEIQQISQRGSSESWPLIPTVLSNLRSASRLATHQPLTNSVPSSPWSEDFRQPEPDHFDNAHDNAHDNAYQSSNLVFRSQLSSSSPAAVDSSVNASAEWNSIEDLLQIPVNNTAAASAIGESNHSFEDASTIANEFTGESLSNSIQPFSTQAITETANLANASAEAPNDSKTLETALEKLAQEIYVRLHQRLAIERERRGSYSGRLSW